MGGIKVHSAYMYREKVSIRLSKESLLRGKIKNVLSRVSRNMGIEQPQRKL